MSLSGSLQIGRSALTASQLAIQVAGNNLANAATPGYSRQVAHLVPLRGPTDASGASTGRGVQVVEVRRAIDNALQARLNDSVSREHAALANQGALAQIESLLNELTGAGLSSELSQFFNAFSELANNPAGSETRAVVVEQGVTLASFVRSLRSDLVNTQRQFDEQLSVSVRRADELLSQIAGLNRSIVESEQGRSTANELRDRRDALVHELSGLMEISTVEQNNGAIDVLVGSTPVVLGANSRGVSFVRENVNGELSVRIIVKSNEETLKVKSGSIGALMGQRTGTLRTTIDELDRIAGAVIHEVNTLHASGAPGRPLRDTTGWLKVGAADRSLSFNDPTNQTFAGLTHKPVNGAFSVRITDEQGASTLHKIDVRLNGIDDNGLVSFDDDTSLEDLRDALHALPGLNAEINASGQLRVFTDTGHNVSFGADTSGVLAVLGINTYFTGTDATDMGVRQQLLDEPLMLSAGFEPGSNEVALAIAGLRDKSLDSLGGFSISEGWLRNVERIAVEGDAANTRAASTKLVRESLDAQRAGVSGVSIDEESLNLMSFQRQYQGAARFISVVDELLRTLISLV
ncbi:MAG: flagellar hook-associated protein FlgK [Phycisphaerales bacterium]|nr:MAG: flagellar hook-associated protein FlgK [Phycisphaerales bacterium]